MVIGKWLTRAWDGRVVTAIEQKNTFRVMLKMHINYTSMKLKKILQSLTFKDTDSFCLAYPVFGQVTAILRFPSHLLAHHIHSWFYVNLNIFLVSCPLSFVSKSSLWSKPIAYLQINYWRVPSRLVEFEYQRISMSNPSVASSQYDKKRFTWKEDVRHVHSQFFQI